MNVRHLTQSAFTCSKLTIETLELKLHYQLCTYLTPCSSVSIANFDQVNADSVWLFCFRVTIY